MTTQTNRTEAMVLAALIAGGVAYAAAQQQPKPPAAKPQPAPQAAPQNPGAENACAQNCGCMHGAQAENGGMMMHGMHGGQGQNGMMNGGMNDGASCPMNDMRGMADIKIENTKNGAIIRMSAKSAEQVARVQQMAQHMTQCMGNAEPAAPEPAAPAPKAAPMPVH